MGESKENKSVIEELNTDIRNTFLKVAGIFTLAIALGFFAKCSRSDKEQIQKKRSGTPRIEQISQQGYNEHPVEDPGYAVITLSNTKQAQTKEISEMSLVEETTYTIPTTHHAIPLDELLGSMMPGTLLDDIKDKKLFDLEMDRRIYTNLDELFYGTVYEKIKDQQNKGLSDDFSYGIDMVYENLFEDERFVSDMGLDVWSHMLLSDYIITGVTEEEVEEEGLVQKAQENKQDQQKTEPNPELQKRVDNLRREFISQRKKEQKEKEKNIEDKEEKRKQQIKKEIKQKQEIIKKKQKEQIPEEISQQVHQDYLLSKLGFKFYFSNQSGNIRTKYCYEIVKTAGIAKEVLYLNLFYKNVFPTLTIYMYDQDRDGFIDYLAHSFKLEPGDDFSFKEIRTEYLDNESDLYTEIFKDVPGLYEIITDFEKDVPLLIQGSLLLKDFKQKHGIDEKVEKYTPD